MVDKITNELISMLGNDEYCKDTLHDTAHHILFTLEIEGMLPPYNVNRKDHRGPEAIGIKGCCFWEPEDEEETNDDDDKYCGAW